MELTVEHVEEAIGPLESYRHQCHAASIALVKSGPAVASHDTRASTSPRRRSCALRCPILARTGFSTCS